MSKKLLIAGGGYADIPLILAAKKLNFHVITSGNCPDDLGHKYSDEYCYADFSDHQEMLAIAKRFKIDAICACSNDFSALTSAYIAEKLGLKGHDPYLTSKIIHHKDLYRKFALDRGISSPKAFGFDNIEKAKKTTLNLSFPLIIKPVDLTGGKGISTINDPSQAKDAIEKAFSISRANRVVIEEFIVGSRHGFSTFVRDGKIVFFFSDNEHYYKNPYMVSAASTPSGVPSSVEKKLCADAEKIVSSLSLGTGIFHIQYILYNNKPFIIEICRRSPGDLYTKFVEIATGAPFAEWIVRASAGLDCSTIEQRDSKFYCVRHCIMSPNEGLLKNIIFDEKIKKNIIEKFIWGKNGDLVSDLLTTKFGIVFLRFDSMDEMLAKTENMHDYIRVETY